MVAPLGASADASLGELMLFQSEIRVVEQTEFPW
jgi:hypothetical protein